MNKLKYIFTHGKGRYFLDVLSTKISKPSKIEETILLFGVPRGGTTWLLNIFSTLDNYKPIHEPFNKYWFPINYKKISGRPYIQTEDKNELIKNYLTKIFSNQIASLNPASRQNNYFSKKILVKFIRANRLMPWISKNFITRSMFLLIRHPCAVISSQIESGIRGYFTKKEIPLNKKIVMADFLKIPLIRNNKRLMNKLYKMKTQEELLAAIWCVDTLIPLAVPDPKPWSIVIYEKLVLNWEDELRKIFSYLNEPVPKKAYEKILIPSRTTKDAAYIGTNKQLSKWKKNLTESQIEQILNILELFDIDFYSRDIEPDYQKLKNWQSEIIK